MNSTSYLLAGRASELERLRLQSIVWEPSARRLLHAIGDGSGMRAVDVGCGVIGWLRVLSEWVGPDGEVVGTDIDDAMLADAGTFVASEALDNVSLRKDDLFTTGLEASSFDLVHARAEVAPLGRGHEQLETYLRLVRPGGTVVLEDPDFDSLRYNPPAPALGKVVALLREGFPRNGGDLDAGRGHRLTGLERDDPPGHSVAAVGTVRAGARFLGIRFEPSVLATGLRQSAKLNHTWRSGSAWQTAGTSRQGGAMTKESGICDATNRRHEIIWHVVGKAHDGLASGMRMIPVPATLH